MRLFILAQKKEDIGYDENEGFVIRAESEIRARSMADDIPGDEGRIWSDTDKVSCVPLTNDGEERIILRDFNAG